MDKFSIYVCNMILTGDIPPAHLNAFLKRVCEQRLDIWSFLDHPKVHQVPLVSTMMMGKLNELKVFLRYGFEKTTSRSLQLLWYVGVINEAISRDNRASKVWISFADVQRFLRNVEPSTERRRRVVIETFAVASLLHTGHAFSSSISLCFDLAWRTTPEPFVKQEEMERIMVLLCGQSAAEGVRKVCETFRVKFGPVAEGPLKPRSLKQLCRCTIRRILTKTFRLPQSIDDLKLPKSLKDYVRLET